MKHRSTAVVLSLTCSTLSLTASGQLLTVYYDPATGNVAFDTSTTPTGGLTSYEFLVQGFPDGPIAFRGENHIRLSDSVFFTDHPWSISDRTRFGEDWRGYYTIGDVFPAGLDAATWETEYLDYIIPYAGSVLRPQDPDLFQLRAVDWVYGQPDREYDNLVDWIDPDTLTWAQSATLQYREATGEVFLITNGSGGGHISSFLLSSDGRFLPDAYTPPIETLLNSTTEDLIGTAADYPVEPGVYSLGAILEAGLSLAEFESLFTQAKFMERAGFNGGSFDFETLGRTFALSYIAVPEPATGLLALAGFLATTRLRRRVV